MVETRGRRHQSSHATGPGAITMMDSRAEVHQATGMLSVQAPMPLVDALVRLRAHTYATKRPYLGPSLRRPVGVENFTFTGEDGHARCKGHAALFR